MDSPDSLRFVNDFERRIRLIGTDAAQERFVRELVSDIAMDCPLPILSQLANCVLGLRKAELRAAGEQN